MAQFAYKAKRGLHERLEGVIEAESQSAALHRLAEQGLFPVQLEPCTPTTQEAGEELRPRRPRVVLRVGRRVTSTELLGFSQNLTTLIRAGVDLLSAIQVLHDQTDEGPFKQLLFDVYNAIKQGQTFSDALARFPKVFSSLFVNVVRSGEASGRLDLALQQLSESLTRGESLKAKVAAALAYPLLLVAVGLASMAVLINVVIPKLGPLFTELGSDLPLMTRVMLTVSAFSAKHTVWIVLVGSATASYLVWRRGGAWLFDALAWLKRNVPIVKRLVHHQEMAHFVSSLDLLLRSGVPALRSLQLVTPSLGDPTLRAQMERVCEQISLGQRLSQSLKNQTDLPAFLVKMVAVGEESGKLDDVLGELARSYHQKIEADISTISSLLEPLLILGMGAVLGVIILSVLLPIFQVTQAVR